MSNKQVNDKLKNNSAENGGNAEEPQMALDDAARVKVLSPGRLVFKRFVRNKLAIVGTCILAALFLFCFLGPLFYPYDQTDIFRGWRQQNGKYAYAQIRTEYVSYWNPECDNSTKDALKRVQRFVNSSIQEMDASGETTAKIEGEGGVFYELVKLSDTTYALRDSSFVLVADYTNFGGAIFKEGYTKPEGDFDAAAKAAMPSGSFEYDGVVYTITKDPAGAKIDYDIYCDLSSADGETFYYFVSTVLTPTFYNDADYDLYNGDSAFKFQTYVAPYTEDMAFEYEGASFTVADEDGVVHLYKGDEHCAYLSNFVATRHNSNAPLSAEFQAALEEVILDMNESGVSIGKEYVFEFDIVKISSETGKAVYDDNGNPVMEVAEFSVKREQNDYTVWSEQYEYVMLVYEAPSGTHLLGTDAHGMDVLARIMFGGRISLMVGFVVVFLEVILGVIMGGIAGYFGGWVDNLIMRLVDVFYCIPSMPILIITGAMFDSMQMDETPRLIWMMAILGILGWAGIARLVRGQILSLREQEFMVAAEASGLSTKRRIFKHLVPNVMPQLIVSATMGLGSVIITESTLSFLGLGVKHPLATWGNMMNNITQKVEYLSAYAYIWVPIGCLICLAVVAFNFVGDGLRDAFDPKMKR